ncbi:UNVERIFIED_ORG: hypothetical protein J2W38_006074 [Variovorax paradoxus]|nr:hypothetical protein [Variovorax paradoxus]
MPVFADAQALRESLRKAGLNDHARGIGASVRPVLLFVRRQEKDDTLPVGTSKMAGNPDLPPGMPWPMRPALASPERHMAQLRKQIEDIRNPRPSMSETDIEHLLQTMRASGATRKDLELMRDALRGQTQRNPKMDASRIAWLEARMVALQTEFPLAFIAQLDLGQLSVLPGFDPALPRRGVLSIFMDAIGDDDGKTPLHRVYWHDVKPVALRRREWPVELQRWSDRWTSYGHPAQPEEAWSRLAMADRLLPHSGLSVPHHWKTALPEHSSKAIWAWFQKPDALQLLPRLPPGDTAPGGNFGDRLGGWPDDIQGHAEDEVDPAGRHIVAPGRTPWRHLFSYGGEYHAGARRMDTVASGDGNHFLMIRDEDLARRRFERVRDVYQST